MSNINWKARIKNRQRKAMQQLHAAIVELDTWGELLEAGGYTRAAWEVNDYSHEITSIFNNICGTVEKAMEVQDDN